jgi:membrane protease YdiL (CAAX protease family)
LPNITPVILITWDHSLICIFIDANTGHQASKPVLLTWRLRGGAGVKALLARGLRWRVGIQWYLAVLFTAAGIYAMSFGLQILFGKHFPGFAPMSNWAPHFIERIKGYTPSLGLISGTVPLMEKGLGWTILISAFFAIESGGITEEFGWRGFAQTELQGGWSALRAGMTVGLMWAIWHLCPVHLFLTENFHDAWVENLDHYKWYILQCIPLAVLFTWVYNNTGGSVLLTILFHAAFNSTNTTVNGVWPEFNEGYWFIGMLWAAAALVTWWFGPATLVRATRSGRTQHVDSKPAKSPERLVKSDQPGR